MGKHVSSQLVYTWIGFPVCNEWLKLRIPFSFISCSSVILQFGGS
jgi:hypothetical protein